MSEVIAGTACGLLMSVVFTGLGALVLAHHPGSLQRLSKHLPKGVTLSAVLLPLTLFLPPLWGIAGAVMGLLYLIVKDLFPGPGLGSPNLAFTAAVAAAMAFATAALFLTPRRTRWEWLGMNLAFAGIFGWLLPHLAG